MKKTLNPEAVAIIGRFIQALNYAVDSRLIDGVTPWCEEHGLNRTKYNALRASHNGNGVDLNYKGIDVDALSAACRDFGVSAEWLLLGSGQMIAPKPIFKRRKTKSDDNKVDIEVLSLQTQ